MTGKVIAQKFNLTAELADMLIAARKNDANAPKVDDLQPIDAIANTVEDDLEQARRLA